MPEEAYLRVKYLLYFLARDHLPIGTVMTLVGEATEAVDRGIMLPHSAETLISELALQIAGPESEG